MSENSARVFPRLPSVMPAGRNRTSIRLATPLALSLCFHGALFAALAMVTWSLVHTPDAPEPDLSLDLAPTPRRAEVSSSDASAAIACVIFCVSETSKLTQPYGGR